MQPGDRFRSDDGQMVTASEIYETDVEERVYNCRVEEYHTYFVGKSDWGFSVWAHNEYRVTEVSGRRVYQNDDLFELGVPSRVDRRVHPSIRARIARGETNLDLMANGNAPVGRDGRQINLHHLLGIEPGAMVELLRTIHSTNQRVLHGLIIRGTSFRNDPLLNVQYNDFRSAYWQQRAFELRRTTFENGGGI
jgi:hypothetical protein